MRALKVTVVSVAMALALVPSASADSIVYIKAGNVWLASPDGAVQRQVTTGGYWDSPSQADDGTILAQRASQLYRLSPAGTQLDPAIPTIFTGAPPSWAGPVSPVISPDGVNQAYGGLTTDSGVYDYTCNCIVYTHTYSTWWGSATAYSQPGQTLGQEDYVDPAWIDNGHLLMTSNGVLIDQVATYTLGGPDNSLVQWFSDPDPTVQMLNAPAITRGGDKVAFVANTGGALGNEIRIYGTTGPPPYSSGDPVNVPIDTCNLGPHSFESLRVSFSPDGTSLVYDAPDGIHLVSLAGWPSCAGLTDKLIIPGGSLPYFGPANVPTGGGSGSGGTGPGGGGTRRKPTRCVVPRLRGLSLARVRTRLAAAHCRLGKTRRPRGHIRITSLVVSGQRPGPGSVLAAGGQVNVTMAPRLRRHPARGR